MLRLLALTMLIYFLPGKIWLPEGVGFFLYMTTWSTAFVADLHMQKSHVNTAIIAIEYFSVSLNIIGAFCYLLSLKTAYIYEHRAAIITVCFITELVIIFGVRLRYVGGFNAIIELRNNFYNGCSIPFNFLRSIFSRSEALCKAP